MKKKYFVLSLSHGELVDKLSNNQAGNLIKCLFSYYNGEPYLFDDQVVEMVFIIIRNYNEERVEL